MEKILLPFCEFCRLWGAAVGKALTDSWPEKKPHHVLFAFLAHANNPVEGDFLLLFTDFLKIVSQENAY